MLFYQRINTPPIPASHFLASNYESNNSTTTTTNALSELKDLKDLSKTEYEALTSALIPKNYIEEVIQDNHFIIKQKQIQSMYYLMFLLRLISFYSHLRKSSSTSTSTTTTTTTSSSSSGMDSNSMDCNDSNKGEVIVTEENDLRIVQLLFYVLECVLKHKNSVQFSTTLSSNGNHYITFLGHLVESSMETILNVVHTSVKASQWLLKRLIYSNPNTATSSFFLEDKTSKWFRTFLVEDHYYFNSFRIRHLFKNILIIAFRCVFYSSSSSSSSASSASSASSSSASSTTASSSSSASFELDITRLNSLKLEKRFDPIYEMNENHSNNNNDDDTNLCVNFLTFVFNGMNSTRSCWNTFGEYWSLIEECAKTDKVIISWMVGKGILSALIDYYMGDYTIYKRATPSRVKIGPTSTEKSQGLTLTLFSLFELLATIIENSNLNPEAHMSVSNNNNKELTVIVSEQCEIFMNQGEMWTSMLKQGYSVKANNRIAKYLSFNNEKYVVIFAQSWIQGVIQKKLHKNEGKYLYDFCEQWIKEKDNLEQERIRLMLGVEGGLLNIVKKVWVDGESLKEGLEMILNVMKENEKAKRYLVERKGDWWNWVELLVKDGPQGQGVITRRKGEKEFKDSDDVNDVMMIGTLHSLMEDIQIIMAA